MQAPTCRSVRLSGLPVVLVEADLVTVTFVIAPELCALHEEGKLRRHDALIRAAGAVHLDDDHWHATTLPGKRRLGKMAVSQTPRSVWPSRGMATAGWTGMKTERHEPGGLGRTHATPIDELNAPGLVVDDRRARSDRKLVINGAAFVAGGWYSPGKSPRRNDARHGEQAGRSAERRDSFLAPAGRCCGTNRSYRCIGRKRGLVALAGHQATQLGRRKLWRTLTSRALDARFTAHRGQSHSPE